MDASTARAAAPLLGCEYSEEFLNPTSKVLNLSGLTTLVQAVALMPPLPQATLQ